MFVHLNLHTEYSIIDGIVRIEPLMAKCFSQKMPAVAITDQANLFGLIKFYKTALSHGIKPIIGVNIWLENPENQNMPTKLILLAQNQQGYKNILTLISRAYLENQINNKPLVKFNWLQELSAGIIVLSGGVNGEIGQAFIHGKTQEAEVSAQKWLQLFGDRFYLEIFRTGRKHEEDYINFALELAEKYQIPVVATNAVCFVDPSDYEAHEARVCIHDGNVLADNNRPRLYSEQQYLRSPEEMEQLFADIPEAIVNTVEIAKRCSVELVLGKVFLPIFPVPESTTPEKFFAAQAIEGLKKRFNNTLPQEAYVKRLDYEIQVINQMGFASYFLIVADFIRWAKQNGIPVGPGRGSGAGSLVAYSLRITDLDPLEHNLLFERFLNPERISMPDFDVDFCMDGRDRVIEYVMQHYGKERVAQIITYGTMAARAVVRDVGRVLGYAYGFVDKIAKLIPFELGISLEKAIADEELLQQRYDEEEEVKTLIDLALKLEGITRNAGKHAGGVVIAPSLLTDFMPLYCEAPGENAVTQFDKYDVEAAGLVKFDFLGLRTLTIINWALQTINAKLESNGETPIDISQLPLTDHDTYKLLQAYNTTAIFQLESRGMRDLIKKLHPDSFSDIIALVALFRPGPLQSGMVDDYLNRKHGREVVTYAHPKLEPVLKDTYGVILYQEQVMQIAQVLAGYSLGEADILRSAMGKKKPEEMARQRAVFLEGAAKNNIDKHLANNIFDLMEKFAGYGFNKSHSTAYALITYQTAWLKAHYPAEFMAAVLSSDMDNTDKVVLFLNDCKNLGLEIVPPDINKSDYKFTVDANGAIVYGLGAIKGVGLAAIEAVLAAKKTDGLFSSLFDLCKRVDGRKANSRVLEALIRSGALDKIAPHRASALASLPLALKMAEQDLRAQSSGQIDLFSDIGEEETETAVPYVDVPEMAVEERLQGEKAVLGIYLNGHPIEKYWNELQKFTAGPIAEITADENKSISTTKQPDARRQSQPGMKGKSEGNIVIAGFITNVKVVNTKSGNRLAIVTLEDHTGTIDATVFADLFTNSRDLLVADKLVIIEGELGLDNFTNSVRVKANSVITLEEARKKYFKALWIRFTEEMSSLNIDQLQSILAQYRGGNCPVFIAYKNGNAMAKLALGEKWKVTLSDGLLNELRLQFGEANVKLV